MSEPINITMHSTHTPHIGTEIYNVIAQYYIIRSSVFLRVNLPFAFYMSKLCVTSNGGSAVR